MNLILVALVNAAVGLLIGWSGIAGFLLPMFYVGYLGLGTGQSLALSFASFAVSGGIGSLGYYKKGSLPLKPALLMGYGSLPGAVLGVQLNRFIPSGTVKVILYLVVLASGASILIRMRAEAKKENKPAGPNTAEKAVWQQPAVLVMLGFATAVVCALSGAGGPILVMPLLVVLGAPVRDAIGIALFDSLLIAIPSFIGYAAGSSLTGLWPLLALGCLAHGAGVLVGSHSAHIIKQKPLKIAVAVFSILVAVYMIIKLF